MLFCNGMVKVGEGSCVRFWLDVWVGSCSLCHSFPRLFKVVSNKEFVVKDCYV